MFGREEKKENFLIEKPLPTKANFSVQQNADYLSETLNISEHYQDDGITPHHGVNDRVRVLQHSSASKKNETW